ncbi:MAG: radical SAM family heme chaperone HemW [Rhodospirillaceae bacterium]|nr:radical SAM family heme chaperone HemW [Rhodospirillaceae bacterium]
MTESPETAFHLYVHWPYCRSKCGYCDFASFVPTRAWNPESWASAYLADIRALREKTGTRQLGSIFFGGGTPSLAEPMIIGRIIDAAIQAWEPRAGLEVTLEANPGTVNKKGLRALRDVGINRLSVGAQSFLPKDLVRLGRTHSVDETKHVLTWAHDIFERLSLDLITARPAQTLPSWRAELAEALDFAGEHLSVYQLTVEEGTPLSREVAAGRVTMLDEDTAAAIFEETRHILTAAGRPAYEVSNFARPGAECRHNMAIWRGADYGGIGPAAHGRLTTEAGFAATHHAPDPSAWLAGPPEPQSDVLTVQDRAREHVLMVLRLTEGLSFGRFTTLFAPWGLSDPWEILNAEVAEEWVDLGLLEGDETALRATESGMMVLNTLISRLVMD